MIWNWNWKKKKLKFDYYKRSITFNLYSSFGPDEEVANSERNTVQREHLKRELDEVYREHFRQTVLENFVFSKFQLF